MNIAVEVDVMKRVGNNRADTSDHLNDKSADQKPLEEGIDYYLEDGLLVFTAQYLRERGYCCENDCRHCPYKHQSDMDG